MEVTETAAAIAQVRAEERLLPEPERLFEDPFAPLFVPGGDARRIADTFLSVPFFRSHVRLRTRFIDDFVRAGLADGIRQIVILGAGFDCRALRLTEIRSTSTGVFEVDFAVQIARKRAILEAASVVLPAHLRFVGCDFSADEFAATLAPDLAAVGFHRDERAMFVWEGVVGYLEDRQFERCLHWIAGAAAARSRLVFNYTTARLGSDRVAACLRRSGFVSIEDVGCDDVQRRYIDGPVPDVATFFRLVTALT